MLQISLIVRLDTLLTVLLHTPIHLAAYQPKLVCWSSVLRPCRRRLVTLHELGDRLETSPPLSLSTLFSLQFLAASFTRLSSPSCLSRFSLLKLPKITLLLLLQLLLLIPGIF